MKIQNLINRGKRRASERGGVMAGCLIALAIVAVLAIIGIIVVAMYWKTWTADGIDLVVTQAINESTLPDAEKPEMIAVIDAFTDRFKDGDISFNQLMGTFQDILQSDLFPIGTAYAFASGYIEPSGLTDEEKDDGRTQMHRIAVGLRDGTFTRDDFELVFQPVNDPEATAQVEFEDAEGEIIVLKAPEQVTDDEIREVIEAARTLADDNGVTSTPEVINLSEALQAEIDASLAGDPDDEADAAEEPVPALDDAATQEEPAPAGG